MRTEKQAARLAERTAKKLGEPWKPYVWENLGWHCAVVIGDGYLFGGVTMYIYTYSTVHQYSVMGINRTLGEGSTPLMAIRKAYAHLEATRKEATRFMAPLRVTLKRRRR